MKTDTVDKKYFFNVYSLIKLTAKIRNVRKKYLQYNITTRKAGLKHQSYNLKTLIAEACALGRIPVISQVYLYGKHNNGNELYTTLGNYYDLRNIRLKGKKKPICFPQEVHIEPKFYKFDEVIPSGDEYVVKEFPLNEGCSWKYAKTDYDIYYDVKLPYTKQIEEKAKKVIDKLEKPYSCVHVRRGDVVRSLAYKYWPLIWDTKPSNIIEKLNENKSPLTVYIMTNERKRSFFDVKNSNYNILLSSDFPILAELSQQDNYLLFCIENMIMENAQLRISTFKDDNPLYHDSLSNVKF